MEQIKLVFVLTLDFYEVRVAFTHNISRYIRHNVRVKALLARHSYLYRRFMISSITVHTVHCTSLDALGSQHCDVKETLDLLSCRLICDELDLFESCCSITIDIIVYMTLSTICLVAIEGNFVIFGEQL